MRCTRLTFIGTVLGIVAWNSCSAGAYTDQVREQIGQIRSTAEADGWQETHTPKYDSLRNGQYSTYNVTLRAKTKYKIIGVCDNDCPDLDIFLYDENDNEISRDTSTDSIPVVNVTPKWTGSFKLKVRMYACRNNPCYMGVSIIGK